MDNQNEFPNDNNLVNPEDPYSPTEKEVREYMEMGYSRSGAISSLTTTKKTVMKSTTLTKKEMLREWMKSVILVFQWRI
jgi:hypothetical protein